MKILITGGAGFIGSNFLRFLIRERPEIGVVNLDRLTYAGNLENLEGLEALAGANYRFVRGDIADPKILEEVWTANSIDTVINFAAESHVDRSIESAEDFIRTNVTGTLALLEVARKHGVKRFLQISTDEVYGSLGPIGKFVETTPLSPRSPYSASKASADLLSLAFFETYKLPVLITRCSNNYGPYQFPEKLIPLMISNALEDKPLPVYGDGQQVRDWIHVEDHCRALLLVLEKGTPGEVYNVGGGNEWPNIEIVKLILGALGKPDSLIKYVADRPGHDRRYAIDFTRIERELGWRPRVNFAQGIKDTIDWYVKNKSWWGRIKSGEYQKYYEKMY
ncbi:MAG: dTDP-glucose 4,6-dehydratase, partial [Proteobacteria bacterium]|nr:dTDP-glucose 4,6-dehydratase [Pseudomonadota bacterium]